MNDMETIRIYFESKTKAVGLTRWQRLWNNRLSSQLIKMCKSLDMKQVICFDITAGYLNHQRIQWGISEVPTPQYPQCIEITDTPEKIAVFEEYAKAILQVAQIYHVEKQELVVITRNNI